MKKFSISNVYDLYKIKNCLDFFDEVNIHPNNIVKKGVLRYALKYAYWKLNHNGKIIIHAENNNQQKFNTKKLSTWQYVVTLNLLFPDESLNIKKNTDNITLTKKNENKLANGVSIGILFSGKSQEIAQLNNAISALKHSPNVNYELVICGPSDFDFSHIKPHDSNLNITYLPFDIKENDDRVYISEKKNFIYESMQYDIKTIAHTRIKYPPNFIESLFTCTLFDIATPRITDYQSNYYLDLILIGSYDVSKINPRKSISGNLLGKNYLNYMSNRVAYIDGGIIILNSQNITWKPFNNNIAWGEGEDLDLARVAYSKGLLIDLIDNIECTSMTTKFKQTKNIIDKIKIILKRILVSKNLL